MNTTNDFDSLSYAEKLADEIAAIQWQIDIDDPANRADWWFSVMTNLSTLLNRYYKNLESIPPSQRPATKPSTMPDFPRPESTKTVAGAPWKTQPPPWKPQAGNNDSGLGIKELLAQFKAEHPEGNYAGRLFDDRPEQHNADGLRILALENQVAAITDWADIRYLPNEAGDYVTHNCIHDLIAEGMTGVTSNMHINVALEVKAQVAELSSRLVEQIESSTEIFKSVTESFVSMGANVHCAEYNADLALDRIEILKARIDAWEQRAELLEQRLEALESKAPC